MNVYIYTHETSVQQPTREGLVPDIERQKDVRSLRAFQLPGKHGDGGAPGPQSPQVFWIVFLHFNWHKFKYALHHKVHPMVRLNSDGHPENGDFYRFLL